MLFRKKKKKEEPRVCTGCGCLIDRLRAKKIVQEIYRANYDTAFTCFDDPEPLFYCGRCAPQYDWVIIPAEGGDHQYFTRVIGYYDEVDKEGKPLKKKK